MRRILILLLALALAPSVASAKDGPRVVVGVKPIHSLVAGLMAEIGEPRLLIDGVPFGVEADEEAKKDIAGADLVIWIGPELESGFADAIAAAREKGVPVLELLSDSNLKILPVYKGPEESRDPYIWLDSRNAKALVDVLADALAEADPDHAAQYLVNRRRVKVDVAHLDRTFEYGFRAVAGKPVFLYHETQQYFAQAYALHVAGRLMYPGGPAPGGAAVLEAVAEIRNGGAACVLVEAGLPAPNVHLIAEGAGVPIVEIDSFATRLKPGPDLYGALMRFNFQTISGCAKRD